MKTEMRVRWQGYVVLVISLFAATCWAVDAVHIGDLLGSPVTFHGYQVQLTGVVSAHRMETFVQSAYKRTGCTQHFTIEDETGTLEANYETLCPAVILKNGDRATIYAQFLKGSSTPGVLNVWKVDKK